MSEDRLGGVGSLCEAEEQRQRCSSPPWFYGRVSLLPEASSYDFPPTRRWSEWTGGLLHAACLLLPLGGRVREGLMSGDGAWYLLA